MSDTEQQQPSPQVENSVQTSHLLTSDDSDTNSRSSMDSAVDSGMATALSSLDSSAAAAADVQLTALTCNGDLRHNVVDSMKPSSPTPSTSSSATVIVEQDGTDNEEEVPVKYFDTLSKDRAHRLEYLLKQTEIFAHFLANGRPESAHPEPKQKAGRKNKHAAKPVGAKSRAAKTSGRGRKRKASIELLSKDEELPPTRFDTTPDYIQGTMRDYQIRGLNWMISLFENGINGILADEMGLGKTLQTISLLGYLMQCRRIRGPHLIVAPKSTLANWHEEIQRFCPCLTAFILIGDKNKRKHLVKTKVKPNRRFWNVLITSYEVVVKEKASLGRINWRYVVVDEGHKIKHEQTQLATRLRQFKCTNRLLLTGTPLQNNLHELWSLLNFLLPDVFNSSDDFDGWFHSQQFLQSNELVQRLHGILKPFLLRRLKADVEKQLKQKVELIIHVGMSQLQHENYKKILLKEMQVIRNNVPTKASLNNLLMHLRKCCVHPYLFSGVEPGPPFTTGQHLVDNCGKMVVLDKLLHKLKEQGSRVLIFSQMTRFLDILEDYCSWRKFNYCRLDGNTDHDDRTNFMREFNAENSEKFIFMLSTRAGGLGINLATADVVIIYDTDWNPQADLQAMDRAHRIGQKKQVRVFRLITENSVEERILEVAMAKLQLNSAVIQSGGVVEANSIKVDSKNILAAVRRGIDQIFGMKADQITDEDIDAILERAQARTEQMKLDNMNKDNLHNFTLDTEVPAPLDDQVLENMQKQYSLYNFEGKNYKAEKNKLKQLEADVVEGGGRTRRSCVVNRKPFYVETDNTPVKKKVAIKPLVSLAVNSTPGVEAFKLFDFQFASKRLQKLLVLEHRFRLKSAGYVLPFTANMTAEQLKDQVRKQRRIHEARPLTAEELDEKVQLSKDPECFLDWNQNEYERFLDASMDFGCDAHGKIAQKIGSKTEAQVTRYAQHYWTHYDQLKDYENVKQNMEEANRLRMQISLPVQSLTSENIAEIEFDFKSVDQTIANQCEDKSAHKSAPLSSFDINSFPANNATLAMQSPHASGIKRHLPIVDCDPKKFKTV